MYIQPNSQIKLLKNVPLDTTYNHTILFSNASAQSSYFISCAKYSLDQQSYQRVNKGSMRVQVNAENLYDCNYLMFQNTSFGQKWFYAFITSVEYVNNETSEVTYIIDPMQTYLFDVELKQCFVEREHSSTDVAGDNVLDEPINTGDMVISDIESLFVPVHYAGVIAMADPTTGTPAGGVKNGLFTGVDYKVYAIDSPQDVSDFKDVLHNLSLNVQNDCVVSVFMMPTVFADPSKVQTPAASEAFQQQKSKPTSIDGYTPRNKKLLTFPYNYMVLDTFKDSGIYRYEWFHGNYTNWEFEGVTCPNAQVLCIPRGYGALGKQGGIQYNYSEGLVLENFPQIAYTIDSYRAYLAQTAVGSTTRGIEEAFNANGGSMLPQAPTSNNNVLNKINKALGTPGKYLESALATAYKAISGSLTDVVTGDTGASGWDTFRKTVNTSKHPNKASGAPSGEIMVANRYHGFWIKQMCVSNSYARMIDDFFDMYGYTTNRIKIPNRTIRPHWNYVKTNGCVVVGNAPADDVKAICQIYDNGITFWKTPSEVGNYSLNNSL